MLTRLWKPRLSPGNCGPVSRLGRRVYEDVNHAK
jgi:hypothetical protein